MKKLLVLLLTLVVLFGSCTKPEEMILGKWQDKDMPITIQFFADGSLTCASPGVNPVTKRACNGNGKYKFIEDGKKMEFDWPDDMQRRPDPEIVRMDIKKDEFIIFDDETGGSFLWLRRVK